MKKVSEYLSLEHEVRYCKNQIADLEQIIVQKDIQLLEIMNKVRNLQSIKEQLEDQVDTISWLINRANEGRPFVTKTFNTKVTEEPDIKSYKRFMDNETTVNSMVRTLVIDDKTIKLPMSSYNDLTKSYMSPSEAHNAFIMAYEESDAKIMEWPIPSNDNKTET